MTIFSDPSQPHIPDHPLHGDKNRPDPEFPPRFFPTSLLTCPTRPNLSLFPPSLSSNDAKAGVKGADNGKKASTMRKVQQRCKKSHWSHCYCIRSSCTSNWKQNRRCFQKKIGIYLFRLMIHCPFISLTVSLWQMAALLGPSWKSRQPRMCQYCQRMFSNKFNLKQHILNMHTVGRELACEICQKKVKNKWYLRRHHVTHHGAPLKKWEKDRDHLRGQYPYHMLYDPFRLSWKKLISFHRASPENPRKFSAMQPSANNMGTIIVFNGITSYRCTTIIVFVPFNNHRPDIYSHTVKSRCPECKNKSVLYHFLCMSRFFIKWFFKHKKKFLVLSNWNKKIKVMATPSRLQEIMMHFERHCEEKDDFQFRTGPFSLDSYQAAINEIVNASPSLRPPLSRRWMPIQIEIPS